MSDERVHIEVGFAGGGLASAVVAPSAAQELHERLRGDPSGTLDLEGEDGSYTIVLSRVAYVKRFRREGRVGFGDS